MHHLEQEISRHQISMIALEEMVSKDSYARLVDIFVDALPLDELGFKHSNCEAEGRPPYHPAVLLKLYMYGYRHGLRSSSKLHKACLVNIELWWLLKGLKPSPRTILYFRSKNASAFKKAFQHFVLLLKQWKLIDGETIAIDSFKIRGQNSLKNNFNQKKIDRHIGFIEDKIAQYEAELNAADNLEQQAELDQKINHQKEKKVRYQSIEKKIAESNQTQFSSTDQDARAVILHRNIVNVGYNIQAGSDSKNKLFINAQTGSVNDSRALADMAIEAKELLDVEHMNTLTDKGYTTGEEIDRCTKNNITTFSSPKNSSAHKNGLLPLTEFTYNKQTNSYTCPANQELKTTGTIYKKGGQQMLQYSNRQACKSCAIKHLCTERKHGRLIRRSFYHDALDANQKRIEDNPDYYRLRQQVTEHQFGTLKRQWGFTYTLLKGKENVLTEVYINFSVYNLIRATQILGVKDLITRLKNLTSRFLGTIDLFLALFQNLLSKAYYLPFARLDSKHRLSVIKISSTSFFLAKY